MTRQFESENQPNRTPENRDLSAVPREIRPHVFRPGQSGNPGGRPKRKPLTEELEKILQSTGRDPQQRTYAKRLMESAVKRAIKKSDFALKEVWERTEGKVPQAVTGEDGGPVQFQVAVIYASADPQSAEVIDSEIVDKK